MTAHNSKQADFTDNRGDAIWTSPFIMLTLCSFLLFFCLQMLLSPFPSYVKDRFHPDDFTVSLVTGLFALTAILSRLATSKLMKRMSRMTLLYMGIVIAAGATAAYSFAGSVAAVLALRVLFGVGFGICSTILPTIVTQLLPAGRLGEGVGYFGLSTSLAMSIGPMVGLNVLHSSGFPTLTLYGTLSALFMMPLLFAGSKGVRPSPAAASSMQKTAGSFNKKLILPPILNAMMATTYGGLLGFLALFGQQAGIANVGLFFLCNAGTVLAVRPISGRLFDSRGHGVVLIPAALILTASLLILSYTTSVPMLVASALLYGLGFGSIQPTVQAWMLRVSKSHEHGTVNSLFYNSTDVGVAFGSILLGLIASASSYAVMYRFAAGVMLLFAVVYIASMLAARKQSALAGQTEISAAQK